MSDHTAPGQVARHRIARLVRATGFRSQAEINSALARWGTPEEQKRARKAERMACRTVARERRGAQ